MGHLGVVGRGPVLLKNIGAPLGHLIHPRFDNIPDDVDVASSVETETPLKEVGRHDVPLVGDDPHHHHSRGELGRHDHRDGPGVAAKPPVVLPVDLLVLGEVFFIGKKNQLDVLSGKVLDLVQHLLGFLQPDDHGPLRDKLPPAHLVGFIADVDSYIPSDGLLVNPHVRGQPRHGPSWVAVDLPLELDDEILVHHVHGVTSAIVFFPLSGGLPKTLGDISIYGHFRVKPFFYHPFRVSQEPDNVSQTL